MTPADLIKRFRRDMDDESKNLAGDYEDAQWSTAEVEDYCNDAEREAVERGRLIFDRTTSSITRIVIGTGSTVYALNGKILEVTKCIFDNGTERFDCEILDPTMLDTTLPDWRVDPFSTNKSVMIHETKLELVGTSDLSGSLYLEVYRLPTRDATEARQFEIADRHHIHLLDWMKHLAYSKREADVYSPQLAAEFEERFRSRFGEKKRATTFRHGPINHPHRNRVYA